jgi:hypothetical protein
MILYMYSGREYPAWSDLVRQRGDSSWLFVSEFEYNQIKEGLQEDPFADAVAKLHIDVDGEVNVALNSWID